MTPRPGALLLSLLAALGCSGGAEFGEGSRDPVHVSLFDVLLGHESGPVRVAGYCAQLPGQGYGLFLGPDLVRAGLEKNGLNLVGDSLLLSSACRGYVEVIGYGVRYGSGDTWGGGVDEIESIRDLTSEVAVTPNEGLTADEGLSPGEARAPDEAPTPDP